VRRVDHGVDRRGLVDIGDPAYPALAFGVVTVRLPDSEPVATFKKTRNDGDDPPEFSAPLTSVHPAGTVAAVADEQPTWHSRISPALIPAGYGTASDVPAVAFAAAVPETGVPIVTGPPYRERRIS
jgi:hypothetical protein